VHNEYDYEVDQAREWLGLDEDADRALTFGDYAWMLVQFTSVSTFVLGLPYALGIIFGVI
jgi:hypothetical protein